MNTELIKSEASFSFSFEGDNEIDAEILSKTIASMAELTKIAATTEDHEAYFKMNVTAFRNGSFQIDFSAVCESATTVFQGMIAVTGLAATVVGITKGYLEIKKMLKGKEPKAIVEAPNNNIEVESYEGKKIIVPKSSGDIIYNIKIDQITTNISAYAQEHNPDGGFIIRTGDGESYFSPKDIKSMTVPLPIIETTTCLKQKIKTKLFIRKADILKRSKWGFIYDGKNIDATIADEDFIITVHQGEAIRSGDYIIATMEICVDLDVNNKIVDGTDKYTILKVHGPIRHGYEQVIAIDEID